MGRHSLAVRRQHTDIHLHLERNDLDMDGAKAGIIVVDTHTKVSDLLSTNFLCWFAVFIATAKDSKAPSATMCKALKSWWCDQHIHRSKTVPLSTKCKRVHNHAYNTVLNCSNDWPWIGCRDQQGACLGRSDIAIPFPFSHAAG